MFICHTSNRLFTWLFVLLFFQVEQVVAAAAQPVSLLHRAKYVRLQQLEEQLEMVEGSLELWQQQQQWQQPASRQPRRQAQANEAVAAVQQAAALAAVAEAAAAEQVVADNKQQVQQLRDINQQGGHWQGSLGGAAASLRQALAEVAPGAQSALPS